METKKILYFDDEMSLAQPVVKNLERKGLKIRLVSTIHDFFIELNNDVIYDLFILDIMSSMPAENSDEIEKFNDIEINQMNSGNTVGEVLYTKIKEKEKYKNIPVLFYSAKRNINIMDDKTDYLRKPELASEIFDKIKDLTSGKK